VPSDFHLQNSVTGKNKRGKATKGANYNASNFVFLDQDGDDFVTVF
jgi:hypothetical protein